MNFLDQRANVVDLGVESAYCSFGTGEFGGVSMICGLPFSETHRAFLPRIWKLSNPKGATSGVVQPEFHLRGST